ncbi:hypothetical protein D3C84_877110 [compost metagenome]
MLQRKGSARQPGASASGYNWNVAGVTNLEECLHLLDTLGQDDQHRHDAIGREAVALVGSEVFLAVQDFQVGQGLAQRGK